MATADHTASLSAFEQRVLNDCLAQAMFSPGDRVVVALSGGADSMALLTLLRALAPALELSLAAAHVHHGIRGAEADRDLSFVRAHCTACGIPLYTCFGDAPSIAAREGLSLEQAARSLRYDFFDTLDADRIATAHNADDNAETVLLHLLRGTGLRGLGGIPPLRGRLVRPLLGCTRAELTGYLRERGIDWVSDSTNDEDSCVRNRVRHNVMPQLRRENPRFLQAVGRTAALVREEDDYLAGLAADAAAHCQTADGWSCAALRALHPVLRRRILLGMLRDCPVAHPGETAVQTMEAAIFSDHPSARLPVCEGWFACRSYDNFSLSRQQAAVQCPETALKIPGETILFPIHVKIDAYFTECSNFSQKNLNTFALNCDIVTASSLCVRTRRSGDVLRLPGGSRSLKRLMIDRKIPAARRSLLPVLLCGDRVIGVFGLGADPDWLARPGQPALVVRMQALTDDNAM